MNITGSEAALCLFLLMAGITDVRKRKVYNEWLIFGTILGIFFRGSAFPGPAALGLLFGYLGFLLRLFGAGDGKLIAVITGWLGVWDGVWAVWFGMIVGVLWSLVNRRRKQMAGEQRKSPGEFLVRVREAVGRFRYEGVRGGRREDKIPLAACQALGTVVYLFVARDLL